MYGGAFFGKSYYGRTYWGPGSGTPTVSSHSPFYSEFSEYEISDGKLQQRFPWGKKKRPKRDDQDIQDILSAIPWGKLL